MSANQHLVEVFTRRQILVQRFGGTVVNEVDDLFDAMLVQIRSELAGQPTDFAAQRLVRLGRVIEQIVEGTGDEMVQLVLPQIEEFAIEESRFYSNAVDQVVSIDTALPAPEQVIAAVNTTPTQLVTGDTVRSATLQELFEEFTEKKPGEVARTVQAGFVSGRTTQQITRDISKLVNNRTRKQAEALVRTALNHVGSTARAESSKENEDVISHEEWLSTLDSRTSLTCQGLDSKQFPIGDGPYPPQHFNCRSIRVPVVKLEFALPGFDGERASVDGPTPTTTTYNSFLKRQSKTFQDAALGPERAKLFRSGGLHVDRFTDDNGVVLTLEELRALEPVAFERAGL